MKQAVIDTTVAVNLFESKQISSGEAAQLAGIDRTTFLLQLCESGVSMIDLHGKELEDDVRNAGPHATPAMRAG